MNKGRIAIYSSSSESIPAVYFQAAHALCAEAAQRGWGMVYGAGQLGLMGECARTMREQGAEIHGVIPEALNVPGVVYEDCTTLTVTKTMGERKKLMEDMADAFIALPGSFGTMEELFEVITLKQLGYHHKAIVLLNVGGYFDSLLAQIQKFMDEGFTRADSSTMYFVANDEKQALDYIERYRPVKLIPKWMKAPEEEGAAKEDVCAGSSADARQ